MKKVIMVAGAMLKRNGKTLFAKRAKGELKDYWEFPGGKIENGETPDGAIIREIKEELDLDIKPVRIIGTFIHEYNFAIIEMVLVECEIIGNSKITLDGSHTEFKWADIKHNKLKLTPMDEKIMGTI